QGKSCQNPLPGAEGLGEKGEEKSPPSAETGTGTHPSDPGPHGISGLPPGGRSAVRDGSPGKGRAASCLETALCAALYRAENCAGDGTSAMVPGITDKISGFLISGRI